MYRFKDKIKERLKVDGIINVIKGAIYVLILFGVYKDRSVICLVGIWWIFWVRLVVRCGIDL